MYNNRRHSKSNESTKGDYYTDMQPPGQFLMNLRLTNEQRDLTMINNPTYMGQHLVLNEKLLSQHAVYLYEKLLNYLVQQHLQYYNNIRSVLLLIIRSVIHWNIYSLYHIAMMSL